MIITEYIPIEKQYLLDAQKYIERASAYLAEGKSAHCSGCLAKAAKKLHRYEEFNRIMNENVPVFLKGMLNDLAKKIEDGILKS